MSSQLVPILVLVGRQIVGKQYFGLPVSEMWEVHQTIYTERTSVAGFSIGIGLLRIAFPESKQFLEAKKAGKRSKSAGEFWKETRSILGKEWRMCVYCVILMTWVSCDHIFTN